MNLLVLDRITRRFGGLTAVNNVSFTVAEGQVVGLIGPNGAGKTTVFNLITGNYRPDEGSVILEERFLNGLAPHRIVQLGIARTFQTIRLFQNMSVIENVLAGCHCRMRTGIFGSLLHTPGQRREEREQLNRALAELAFVGLQESGQQLAKNLSYGNQRLLEIARALATSPKLLILDEPAGGMNEQETQQLIALIVRLRARGLTILLIEHDMKLVMKACDRLVVIEYGSKIAEGTPEEIQRDPRVIAAYLGTDNDDSKD
ncbi:ABC transporter ATP-binding protein [Desulfobulbus oligotrophicus]|uniref:ABC transporter ATP-binding protein n=1 Tax=Desulfobulbus oligotrophicus TaxID=1909699 RepID=A0A7T6AQ34_9BACT|nr:ABC transporter ATP-binding protein [Desulfobulbus oligotrophicus]QQG65301.1 ABC transporter ATP-binding protein [Desulfobulbus oligotrophicus]